VIRQEAEPRAFGGKKKRPMGTKIQKAKTTEEGKLPAESCSRHDVDEKDRRSREEAKKRRRRGGSNRKGVSGFEQTRGKKKKKRNKKTSTKVGKRGEDLYHRKGKADQVQRRNQFEGGYIQKTSTV